MFLLTGGLFGGGSTASSGGLFGGTNTGSYNNKRIIPEADGTLKRNMLEANFALRTRYINKRIILKST